MLKIPKKGWLLKAGIIFLASILGVFMLLPGGFLFAQDVSWAGQWQGWFSSESSRWPGQPEVTSITIFFTQDNSNVVGTMDGAEFFRGTADGLKLTGLMMGDPFEFTMSTDGSSIRGYGERQWNEYTIVDIIEATRVSDTEVVAEPAADGFTITASSGSGGSISDEGVAVVAGGASKTYTITPQGRDYEISDVVVDGMSVGVLSSYTFENVQSNHSIYVDFGVITRVDEPEADAEPPIEEFPYTGFDWIYSFMGLGMLIAGGSLMLTSKKLRRNNY